MQRFANLSPGILLCLSVLITIPQRFRACLPPETKLADVVSAQLVKSTNTVKKVTVEQKLIELKAHCKEGKLLDAGGNEICFYRLKGCWGNPPVYYQEILQHQNEELAKLRKRYTVIEMTCNPDGVLVQ